MVVIVAQFTVKKGMIDAFMKEVAPLIAATRKESGCIDYILHQDVKTPEDFAFIEHWKDQPSVDAHMNAPHFKEIVPKLNALRVAPSVVHLYTPLP